MKIFQTLPAIALLGLLVVNIACAEIYKWVDENGTVHFSDKPYAEDAQKFDLNPTGIKFHEPGNADPDDANIGRDINNQEQTKTTGKHPPLGVSSDSDYKVFATVGKLRDDYIEISGRVSKGPACDRLEVRATASNENGLRASITEETRLTTSWGSTTFSGKQMVNGSSGDRGFWEVDNISIKCLDQSDKQVENDSPYQFNASVGKIGADIIKISGRVKSGPKCNNLIITATASTDTGLSVTVNDTVRKPNSFGSVVFEGNAKVENSSEDNGFWRVDNVKAQCVSY